MEFSIRLQLALYNDKELHKDFYDNSDVINGIS